MEYILRYPLTSDDIEFFNNTNLDFEIANTRSALVPADSGWCDMPTNARIINQYDRAIFKNITDSDLTFLNLKFGDRIKLLTSGLREIYNVAEQHNAAPEVVVDSEQVI